MLFKQLSLSLCLTHTHSYKIHTSLQLEDKMSCLCKRRLPHVSGTTGDIFFCSLLFPLISFVGYCGRLVRVSLMCVCVCGKREGGGGRGLKQAEGCHSYSFSFLGTGQEVGSTEETWPPPPLLFSLYPQTFSPSLCLSPLRSAPTHCHFSFLVPDTSRAVTCSCGVCV